MRQTLFKHAYHYYPTRGLPIDLAVVHCTQSPNPSAVGVSNYFATPQAGGSTEYVIDDVVTVRCLYDYETPWGAFGHNSNGMHFELCGYAEWSREEWLKHMPTIIEAARLIAETMKTYSIPFVYPAPIVNGRARNGIHEHYKLPGNDHTDPEPGRTGNGVFPMDVLLAEIKKRLGIIHAIKTSKTVITLRDVRRRNNITILIDRPDGTRMVGSGWRSKQAGGGAQDMLAWLADFDNKMNPETVIHLVWQGALFSSEDPRYGQDGIRKVARSIYTRFAS